MKQINNNRGKRFQVQSSALPDGWQAGFRVAFFNSGLINTWFRPARPDYIGTGGFQLTLNPEPSNP